MTAGFVGVLPRVTGIVALGLEDGTLARWDRWWEMVSEPGVPPLPEEPPLWRLQIRAGLFAAEPVAGALRLGWDRRGRVYPCAVLRPGPLPETGDPWFDAAQALLLDATDGGTERVDLPDRLAALPPSRLAGASLEGAARLWRDDWAVAELAFATPADLARAPLALLADPSPAAEEAA